MRIFEKSNTKGITLLELIVAITVASVVLSIAFFSFNRLNIDFYQLSNRSVKLQDMAMAKAQIDALMKKIEGIKTISESRMEYFCCNNDYVHVLELRQGKLYNDATLMHGSFTNVKFSIIGDSLKIEAVLWEATLNKNEWIGGSVEIK